MNALMVFYGGDLSPLALEELCPGESALSLALKQGRAFPGLTKTVFLGREGGDYAALPADMQVEIRENWTKKGLLETLARLSQGFDLSYFAWADCPFLDPGLAKALAERHLRYGAEYSYADGWPYGLAPEILSPGTAGLLYRILGEEDGPPGRDCLFSVIQKDINSFDIETEIASVDLRCHRLSLAADSKRNLLLLRRFAEASGGPPGAAACERLILEKPELLRTLPNFFPIQVSGACPQSCALCPYPASGDPLTRRDFMEAGQFKELLDRIAAFSGDAVIDLSLWGELSLHPAKMDLIRMVIERPELALVIETAGIGWQDGEFESALAIARNAGKRSNPLPPLSWIVSLDSNDPQRYREVRGPGFSEALSAAKKLLSLFPETAYVQAVRCAGAEDDIEAFYRFWKEAAPKGGRVPPGASPVIIQKYDDFCGALEKKQASDLSPVKREPCWHIMRDLPVLIDGQVPLCREDSLGHGRILGNVFGDSLESIWDRGTGYYRQHCEKNYGVPCADCDEYYTYNF